MSLALLWLPEVTSAVQKLKEAQEGRKCLPLSEGKPKTFHRAARRVKSLLQGCQKDKSLPKLCKKVSRKVHAQKLSRDHEEE